MQAQSFFSSLFDYSFSSFVTPRIIRIDVSIWLSVCS